MKNIYLFTDAATSPQKEMAVGAYLVLNQQDIEAYTEYSIESLSSRLADIVAYEEYVSKKSTWSEIKTVIHALYTVSKFIKHVVLGAYTINGMHGLPTIRISEKIRFE